MATLEQEINLLANKHGKLALREAMTNFLEKEKDTELSYDWAALAPRYGLDVHLFGATFNHGQHSFTLKEIKPSNRKYPIIADRDDGKSFKFPVDMIKGFFPNIKG